MLDIGTFMPLAYFKKEAYTGSLKGMRYRAVKTGEELEIFVYPEPFCFEATPDSEKVSARFPFTDEGRRRAVDWLNGQYEAEKDRWSGKRHDFN